MYDATIGRFFSADPIGLESGDANFYRYAGNDPPNTIDPDGLKWWWAWYPGGSYKIGTLRDEDKAPSPPKKTGKCWDFKSENKPTDEPKLNDRCLKAANCDTRALTKAERNELVGDIERLLKEIASLASSSVPGIGGIKGALEALDGKDLITERDLGLLERIVVAIEAIFTATGAAVLLAKPLKTLLTRLSNMLKCLGPKAKQLLDRVKKLLDRLPKDRKGALNFYGKPRSCPRLSRRWPAYSPADVTSGCENAAAQILKILGGGTRYTIKPKLGRCLPEFKGVGLGWPHHVVVVKDGRVYDAYTGYLGLTIDEYKSLWTWSGDIEFSF